MKYSELSTDPAVLRKEYVLDVLDTLTLSPIEKTILGGLLEDGVAGSLRELVTLAQQTARSF